MGDLTKNAEILRKLGLLDQSNQWLLYDDRFEKVFNSLARNITAVNIISENEVIDFKDFQNPETLQLSEENIENLEKIRTCTADRIGSLSKEIKEIELVENGYIESLEMARTGKTEANIRLNELEGELMQLEVKESEFLNNCLMQAKQLEALQEENKQLFKESQSRFSFVSPPTLFHLLPLEDYCSRVESCYQYLTLYLQQNYKMLEFHKNDSQNDDVSTLLGKMNNLKEIIEELTLKLHEEKSRVQGSLAMMDELQPNQMEAIDIHDLARKSHELALLNEHHLQVSNDTLLSELKLCVQQVAQYRIELVLLENTKLKLERALKRRESAKTLERLIQEMLLNAELMWAGIQLDMERLHSRVDVQKVQSIESQAGWRRIRKMHNINTATERSNLLSIFLESLSDLIASTSKIPRSRYDIKTCLCEYERFNRQVSQALQNMLNGRAHEEAYAKIKEAMTLGNQLSPIVYDSPIEAPLLYSVKYLRSIFKVIELQNNTVKDLRTLRLHFQTQVGEKMEKDALFRANKLLWVWFLQDPSRVVRAIEEARRVAAAKTMSSVKVLSGIKRKQY